MYAPVVCSSALEYWLHCSSLKKPNYVSMPYISDRKDTSKSIEKDCLTAFIRNNNLTQPVHIMVPSTSMRHQGSMFACHVGSGPFPKNSFILLDDAVVIASPEMCFLQVAANLTIPELVLLACNLCSIYIVDKDEEYGQYSREQITSVSTIEIFLKRASNFPGIKKARFNALTLAGYKVISITSDQLRSLTEIDRIFFLIRKSLNMPARRERFEKHRDARLRTIRKILYG